MKFYPPEACLKEPEKCVEVQREEDFRWLHKSLPTLRSLSSFAKQSLAYRHSQRDVGNKTSRAWLTGIPNETLGTRQNAWDTLFAIASKYAWECQSSKEREKCVGVQREEDLRWWWVSLSLYPPYAR